MVYTNLYVIEFNMGKKCSYVLRIPQVGMFCKTCLGPVYV